MVNANFSRSTVLDALRKKGQCSRMDLRKATGLHISTISNIVDEMIQAGLVEEIGTGGSSGGRKPQILQLRTSGLFALSVVVQYRQLQIALCDVAGKVYKKRWLDLPQDGSSLDAVSELTTVLSDMLVEATRSQQRVLGIGIASPGPLNAEDGTLLSPPNLPEWRNLPLKKILQSNLRVPVAIQKDGHLAALAETWYGNHEASNLLFIILDEGLGGGLVYNGELVSRATEIGHMSISMVGPPCNCGSTGCLEMFASGIALRRFLAERKHNEKIEELPLEKIMEMVEHQDSDALLAMNKIGKYLGRGIGNLINLYNPEFVVIGGRLAALPSLPLETIIEEARHSAFESLFQGTVVETTNLASDYLLLGASALVFSKVFQNPDILLYQDRWMN